MMVLSKHFRPMLTSSLVLALSLWSALSLKVRWVAIEYHKAGHEFIRQIRNTKYCKNELFPQVYVSPKDNFQETLPKMKIHPYVTIAGVDMQFSWDEMFASDPDYEFRIVHFTRDPFEMALSGYLYHSQWPVPEHEAFLSMKSYDPCGFNESVGQTVQQIKSLGEHYHTPVYVSHLVYSIYEMCKEKRDMLEADNYNDRLRKMVKKLPDGKVDLFDGILLEAGRALLTQFHASGELIRMAANVLYMRNSTKVPTMMTHLSDFPAGDADKFSSSANKLFNFLMAPVKDGRSEQQFYDCTTKERAIEDFTRSAYVKPLNEKKDAGFNHEEAHHVTSDFISHEDRAMYIQRLKDHPHIGPLFTMIQKIVLSDQLESA